MPPRCHGCQKWGHTDKNCSKNKKTKETEEESKKPASLAEGNETDAPRAGLETGGETVNENSESIDIEKHVLEVGMLTTRLGLNPLSFIINPVLY